MTTRIFGAATLPTQRAIRTGTSVASPIAGHGAAAVDRLTATVNGERTFAYHHRVNSPPGLFIAHQGHWDDLNDLGIGDVVRAAVAAGWDAIAIGMPGRAGNDGSVAHGDYSSWRNGLSRFIGPVTQVLNTLASLYPSIAMAGVSGGGWTTTVCAAIDERVRYSFDVAGSLPADLRSGGSVGDWEQVAITNAADYPALYALAASNGRQAVQVLNAGDAVFPRAQWGDTYATHFKAGMDGALAFVNAPGSWQFVEDPATAHAISTNTITSVIGPALRW